MSSITCQFCNNTFKSISNLNLHQKTAGFCIKIQKELNNINNEEIEKNTFICEYCNKTFSLKANLKTHYSYCKIKKENDSKKEVEDIKTKLQYEMDQQKIKYEEQIKYKNEQIEKLEKENEAYKNRLFSREEKLTEEIIKRPPTVYQDNRKTTSNYTLQYNKMVEELKPRTNEYIKESIKKIKIDDMIYTNDNAIDYNFACNLVNILKDTVFFTDPSRGRLVYKDENGNSAKMQAEAYIMECIKISKPECIEMCKRSLDIVKSRQKEFTDDDYAKCMVGISQLSDCINKGKQHSIITEISNTLVKASKTLSKQ